MTFFRMATLRDVLIVASEALASGIQVNDQHAHATTVNDAHDSVDRRASFDSSASDDVAICLNHVSAFVSALLSFLSLSRSPPPLSFTVSLVRSLCPPPHHFFSLHFVWTVDFHTIFGMMLKVGPWDIYLMSRLPHVRR
jgi:hypothetical protein